MKTMPEKVQLTADDLRRLADYLDDPSPHDETTVENPIGLYYSAEELIEELNDELETFEFIVPREKGA